MSTKDQTMTKVPATMTFGSVFGVIKAPRWIAAVSLLLATAMPALAQCPPSFAAAANYAIGANPYSVAVGDFNADNRPDLAVTNFGTNNVSILLSSGGGGGTFLPAVNYAADYAPISVAVGDFNADGRPDLAVANLGSDNVSILLGNLSGTFQSPVNYAAGLGPFSVAVGDFNADGQPDLAVVNAFGDDISILLGNVGGGGTFLPAVNYAAGSGPSLVAVGDFNADGRSDLAVANRLSNDVSILLGNAPPNAGTFQAAVNYAAGIFPFSVAVGDFNADGQPDLAVANRNCNNVSILLGNAPPNAVTFQAAVNYAAGTTPTSVAVGDFNADGLPDLAVANENSNNVSILLGNGGEGGTFQVAVNYAAGIGPFFVAVGAFNADGRPDLAVANLRSDNVSILLNANIGFAPPAITQQPASQIVAAGQNAAIAIIANGFGGTLTYQWRKNGVPVVNGGTISGATSPTLSFTPALLSDFASYDVQVTSPGACSVEAQVTTSAAGILGVSDPCAGKQPSITQQPANQAVVSGNAAMFTIAATSPTGGGPLSYQWRKNGVNLSNSGSVSGATSATLTINPAALSDNGSAFDCVVGNACGSVRSNPAGLAATPTFAQCIADLAGGTTGAIPDPDGIIDGNDFIAFINAFAAGC